MGLAAGSVSVISVGAQKASVSSAVATGGTTPYSYQWYRSTTSGFTPGSSTLVSGATSLALNDDGLIPATQYYYKMVTTDSAGTPASVTSSQLSVLTQRNAQNPNQFAQTVIAGMTDLKMSINTVAVQVSLTESGTIYAGDPVKVVTSEGGGAPKVVKCTASSDEVFGFVNYNIKDKGYIAGDMLEVSLDGNCMWLYATAAIDRGAQVVIDIANNGIAPASGNSGKRLVGYAYDKADGLGSLFRVMLRTPSFELAS